MGMETAEKHYVTRPSWYMESQDLNPDHNNPLFTSVNHLIP